MIHASLTNSRRAERGEVLGERMFCSPPASGHGERCISSPSWVRPKPWRWRFGTFQSLRKRLLCSFWATVCTGPLSCVLTIYLSVTLVYCGQTTWMDQDATWYEGRTRPKQHCVRLRPRSAHGKGHSSPNVSARVYCGQTVAHLSNC